MNGILRASVAIVAVSVTAFYVRADDRPGDRAQPLATILEAIEKAGYAPIVEVAFDDGYWEVEAYENRLAYELLVDPESGRILSKHRDEAEQKPPANGIRLSEIVLSLQKAGYADIHEVSFERETWEVEAQRGGTKRELHVDPQTAEVVSDRADD